MSKIRYLKKTKINKKNVWNKKKIFEEAVVANVNKEKIYIMLATCALGELLSNEYELFITILDFR